MGFSAANLQFRFSNLYAGASEADGNTGWTTPQNSRQQSLGRYMSTTQIPVNVSNHPWNNLFDDLTGDENAAGQIDFRCFFILNLDPSPCPNLKLYVSGKTSGLTQIEFYATAQEISSRSVSGWQTATCMGSDTVPLATQYPRYQSGTLASYAFSAYNSAGSPLVIGNLPSDYCVPVWVRRTCPRNTPSASLDQFTLNLLIG